jgi:hypothetical protein
MRSRKLLTKALLATSLAVGTAFAGSTSVDVPVTIDYTGGCIMNVPTSVDLGTVPTIQPKGNGSVLPAISFTVKCTNGVNYTVRAENINTYGVVELTGMSNSNKRIFVVFATDSSYSNYLLGQNDKNIIATGVGDGTDLTITIYPRVGVVNNISGYLDSSASLCDYTTGQSCYADTFSGTLTLSVYW